MAKVILITGCSSGIGKATVEYAVSRGHIVLASAPTEELLRDIPGQAAAKYVIDVCDESTIANAVELATAAHRKHAIKLPRWEKYCAYRALDARQMAGSFTHENDDLNS